MIRDAHGAISATKRDRECT